MHQVHSSPACPQTETSAPIDPLRQSQWDTWIAARPDGSFFQGSAWARVLQETYGHRPVYFCKFGSDRLQSLLPIFEVTSRISGRRGVSLPFTDYCLPLRGNEG